MGRCLQNGRQNPWSNHRAIHPKVCVRCVQRTAGKCWKKYEKMTKTAVLYVFLLSPRYLEKWSNLTSIFFKWVDSTTSERPFFCGRKTKMFQSSYHDAMMPCQSQPCDLCCAKMNAATSLGQRCGARKKCSANLWWLDLQGFTKTTWKRRASSKFLVPQRCWAMGHLNKRLPHK